ncbi:MAG: hypothetical protein J7480_04210 [Microbacteriaceae bacterium]|nr:hypothetical protein [Microbacteriaceae bacterium]
MGKPALRDRWRYWFDGWMSRGTGAIMLLLAIATVVFVAVLGGIAWLVLKFVAPEPEAPEPGEAPWDYFWNALMRTLDPGTMGADQGWWWRILMLLVTIGGLVIVASLIGIVSGAFDAKVEELRKGRSRVLEKDHTLVLGWNNKIFTIVRELAIANESRGRTAIVILADKDKIEMEEAIAADAARLWKTRIVCRTGDPKSARDIALASPQTSRSIILLAPDGAEDPDADVIKSALAVMNDPGRRPGKYHIVGELRDESSLEIAKLVGKDETDWILGTDLIGRITVQTCRQSGLSVVYQSLLAFEGDEFYFSEQPALVGKTYFEAQLAFADSTVAGVAYGDRITVNPPPDTVIKPGDELLVIAGDDSTIRIAAPGTPDATQVATTERTAGAPEHTLFLGANHNLTVMLRELDEYVAPGSTARIVTTGELPELPPLKRLSVSRVDADPTRRAVLSELNVHETDHIIVLAETDRVAPEQADNRTLVTLLQLRDLALQHGADLNVVSEMLDDANRELAEVTEADDFIVSDKLVALALAQASEDRRIKDLYDELFESEGSEIYLRPVSEYLLPGATVDFYTVLESARRRGETAIGYRRAADAHNSGANYGVRVNPRKSDPVRFDPGDSIIVLAED